MNYLIDSVASGKRYPGGRHSIQANGVPFTITESPGSLRKSKVQWVLEHKIYTKELTEVDPILVRASLLTEFSH